jgi:large subunit ribosomal protein L10
MNRQEKVEQVDSIRELLDGCQLVVLAKYSGVDVANMFALRNQLREANGGFRVMKNSLAKLAVSGTGMEKLQPFFRGPVGVAYTSEDPAATAKVLVEFAKTHEPFEIRAGFLEGGNVLDDAGVVALSKLPGRDQLRGMLLGVLKGAPRNLVSVLAGVPRSFVGVLDARRRKLEEAEAA